MNKGGTAFLMKRGADELRALSTANQSLGERMELVYMMLNHAKGSPKDTAGMCLKRSVACELDEAAKSLEEQWEKEKGEASKQMHFPGPADGSPLCTETVGSSAMMKEIANLAADICTSVNQANHSATPDIRTLFVREFFMRAGAMRTRLNSYLNAGGGS